jgi:hypothetical protein
MKNRSGASERRETLRKEYWPKEDPWTGENETGWFRSPRTLPLVLTLLSSKKISGEKDPSPVYLELMARHVGDGVIEMGHEADHAFASGYSGARAVRTWQERMKILERYGFIKTKKIGNQQYRLVLLVHPTVVVQQLRDKNLIPEEWWGAYRQRQLETKELTFEQREKKKKERAKVIPMKPLKSGKVASA